MNRVQRYLFNRVLRSVLIIVGGLTLLAILAQGLSQTDIIVENRQGALTFFKIVALGVPQIVGIIDAYGDVRGDDLGAEPTTPR